MIKRIGKLTILTLLIFAAIGQIPAAAKAPYESYTYSYAGDVQISPNAYLPKYELASFGEAGELARPGDIAVSQHTGDVYIADTENNRIVILDGDLKYLRQISEFENQNKKDSLRAPGGVFITNDNLIYIADTDNGRIVVFDKDGKFLRTVDSPDKDVLPENFKYNPKAIAVDSAGRIYVISVNTNMGVIALDKDGAFEGFIGAQRVSANMLEVLWRTFMTEAQIERSRSFVPVEYSNLTIDEKGLIYVTSSSINRFNLYSSVWSRSSDSTYSPIKKINPAGTDVLSRNGFFPPVGDISFDAYNSTDAVAPSEIEEVSLLGSGMYALMDTKDNKVFFYDSSGNLMYAFGGTGEAVGLYTQLSSVAFTENLMLALDSADGSITVLEKTDYGKLLDKVATLQENREYDKAAEMWDEIIGINNNFDLAYLGKGKVFLEQGDYGKAMEYFELVSNKKLYSRAFKLYRQEQLGNIGIILMLIAVILIVLVVKFFSFAKKYNNRATEGPSKGSLRDELMYGFFAIFHPFKGFWGIKHEKRGSVRGASIFIALAMFSGILINMGSGYLLKSPDATILSCLLNLIFPLILWCVSNTCFTSLMDGKGRFSDVYVAVGYSTIPYTLLTIPCALISHLLITDELPMLAMVLSLATFWMAVLIFFSMMEVHDYSFGKNILISVFTIIGIGFILFLLLIFFNLTGRMISLVKSIVDEISYRA